MDNPINSVDKSLPYPGTGAVKPLHQSEREKERSFAETLQETLDEEQERKKKAKQDEVILGQEDPEQNPEHQSGDEWIPSEGAVPEVAKEPVQPIKPSTDARIDVKA